MQNRQTKTRQQVHFIEILYNDKEQEEI